MTQEEKEFKELNDLFWKLRKKYPELSLVWPKKVSKNRVDCEIRNLVYRGSLIRDVKNRIEYILSHNLKEWEV